MELFPIVKINNKYFPYRSKNEYTQITYFHSWTTRLYMICVFVPFSYIECVERFSIHERLKKKSVGSWNQWIKGVCIKVGFRRKRKKWRNVCHSAGKSKSHDQPNQPYMGISLRTLDKVYKLGYTTQQSILVRKERHYIPNSLGKREKHLSQGHLGFLEKFVSKQWGKFIRISLKNYDDICNFVCYPEIYYHNAFLVVQICKVWKEKWKPISSL
jgi:hypothetical protein